MKLVYFFHIDKRQCASSLILDVPSLHFYDLEFLITFLALVSLFSIDELCVFADCSINTVYYMAPYATMILALPAMLLEGPGIVEWLQTTPALFSPLCIIFGSGVLAFCLNFSIFYVIHSTTAVTFNVAGNLKVRVISTLKFIIYLLLCVSLICTQKE